MASDKLNPVVPGNIRSVSLRLKFGDPFTPSANRVQFTLDSPPLLPGDRLRITKVFNPLGGSDSGVSAVGDEVVLTLTPTETAGMADYPGDWSIVVSVGPANSQAALIPRRWAILPVYTPPGGAVQHG